MFLGFKPPEGLSFSRFQPQTQAFLLRTILINLLLYRLILDHDIIFLSLDNSEKIQENFKLSFEYF